MTFVIIEKDPIVSLDISSILYDVFPTITVRVCDTLALAGSMIEEIASLKGVIVGPSGEGFHETTLPSQIERKGGIIVWTQDGNAEKLAMSGARGWTPLQEPFTSRTLRDALIESGLLTK